MAGCEEEQERVKVSLPRHIAHKHTHLCDMVGLDVRLKDLGNRVALPRLSPPEASFAPIKEKRIESGMGVDGGLDSALKKKIHPSQR